MLNYSTRRLLCNNEYVFRISRMMNTASTGESYFAMRSAFGNKFVFDCLTDRKQDNLRILDLGCGPGLHSMELAAHFPNSTVLGVDFSEDMIKTATMKNKNQSNVSFLQKDILHNELINEIGSHKYDVILLNHVLHHLKEPLSKSHHHVMKLCSELIEEKNGSLFMNITHLKQRKMSDWSFKIMSDKVWKPFVDNDRWRCFDKNDFKEWAPLYDAGFKYSNMHIPNESHWKDEKVDISVALDPQWQSTQDCFQYLTSDEKNEFLQKVNSLMNNPEKKSEFEESIKLGRSFCGEAVVYEFKKGQSRKKTYKNSTSIDQKLHSVSKTQILDRDEGINIEPITKEFGAIVRNIDLTCLNEKENIRNALWKHKLLIIPKSELCFKPKAQLTIASLFGDIEKSHPINPPHFDEPDLQTIPTLGGGVGAPDSFIWHNDMSFREVPSYAGILTAVVIPDHGGDTIIMNTNSVYNNLDEKTKQSLKKMKGHHDIEVGYVRLNRPDTKSTHASSYEGDAELFETDAKSDYAATHPALIKHHTTGLPHVFITDCFVESVSSDSISQEECESAFEAVRKEYENPAHHLVIDWGVIGPGSLLVWDNLGTVHKAPADYETFRLVHRAVTLGAHPPEAF